MAFGLPNADQLEKMFDDDFKGLTDRLDQLIAIQRDILAVLQKWAPPAAASG